MFTVLIDESGNTGLKNVLPDPSVGPTQYFCMAAVMFRERNREAIEREISSLPFLGSGKHSKKLSHFEKAYLSRRISSLPVGIIGVISNKLSLLDYLQQANSTNTHYYNKVTQYLLERLGRIIATLGIDKDSVSIKIEARDQQYSSLISFVKKIQNNPLDHRASDLRHINPFTLSAVKKTDDKCFILADCASNALFSVVLRDERRFCLPEFRYLQELSPTFFASKNGLILPAGIKPIHSVEDLGVPAEVQDFLISLRNNRPKYQML
ncbi:DUF3800 domain-containing protein [Natronohydrobacter thiooxidans]|uniref:DUF3800 domain-containing protein n=1 Tax=Natronohydrobacter thiooxidans TaxID=87172 RepID=UPI0008FF1F31|nr:DUF3800 domain-containing protein [Natronohydrobacter thiooxidans]